MSDQKLPNLINPARLAEKHAKIKGTLPLAVMPRLKDLLADTAGEISVIMDFDRDESQTVFIHLNANTDLILKCQRCMENFSYPILVDVFLTPIMDEAKASGIQNYEPLVMKSELIAIQDIVEDEILLNLPIIAKHTQDICPVVLSVSRDSEVDNPFKIHFSKTRFRGKI
jgi:uncharacterized protein